MTVFRSNNTARFVTPLPALTAWKAERVRAIDAQLREVAAVPAILRTYVHWHRLDRLLDLRNSIWPLPPLDDAGPTLPLRPSVPVVPGRAS